MAFLSLKSPLPLFHLLRFWLPSLIKWFLQPNLSSHLIFLCFLIFLLLTCCGLWLFIGFCVGDSDGSVASIEQRSHIKSLLVSMFHQTWNRRYFRHIMITSCVGLEPFMLAINLDVMSSSNIFSNLIYVLPF